MIVNKTAGGCEIIFQRAHALLAGKIASEVANKWLPQGPWLEILAAIIEHDDGQQKWSEKKFLNLTGYPEDFTAQNIDLVQARKAVDSARYKSRWMALLISMHTSSLYASFNDHREVYQFLTDQKKLQQTLITELGLPKAQAIDAYRFLRWCDELSLLLCKDHAAKWPSKQLIGELPLGTPRYITYGDSLSISPWCFANEEVTFDVECYEIKKTSFNDEEELRLYVENMTAQVKTWKLYEC